MAPFTGDEEEMLPKRELLITSTPCLRFCVAPFTGGEEEVLPKRVLTIPSTT